MEITEPSHRLNINSQNQVFDIIRKKYVALTPEEWVRQHLVHFLIFEKKYPKSLIALEVPANFNQLRRRSDVVVFHQSGRPYMLIECKAPGVAINEKVFEQAGRYNLTLKVNYLIVTNGKKCYIWQIDHQNNSFSLVQDFPHYSKLKETL